MLNKIVYVLFFLAQLLLSSCRPSTIVPPEVDAGPDQTITSPIAEVILAGQVTPGQVITHRPFDSRKDNIPYAVKWENVSKVFGTTITIETPDSSGTRVTGLTSPGVYIFRLKISDDRNQKAYDEVTITV